MKWYTEQGVPPPHVGAAALYKAHILDVFVPRLRVGVDDVIKWWRAAHGDSPPPARLRPSLCLGVYADIPSPVPIPKLGSTSIALWTTARWCQSPPTCCSSISGESCRTASSTG